MCHAPRKEYYKKFLYEAFPVESHLDAALADHMAAEVGFCFPFLFVHPACTHTRGHSSSSLRGSCAWHAEP